MKIKALFTTLCLALGCLAAYGQIHYAPPRKEIRHKIKYLPQENNFLQTATRASGDYIMQEFPTEGEVKGVVILAEFKDVRFSIDNIKALLDERYNANNYTENVEHTEYSNVDKGTIALRATIPGSVRDYFREMSMDEFTPTFDVVGPITLDKERSYYGQNSDKSYNAHAIEMVTEACKKVHQGRLADFSQYGNGDNIVDFVYVVFAGSDEAQTGIEDCVWAHANNISSPLTLDGMTINRYACSGELFVDLNLTAGIGTFVHEFSHILGLPDFYNTEDGDNTKLSMDVWSVMDYGMYNRGGFVPCAYTAFERYSLGWLPMTTLNEPATLSIGTTEEEKTGYRIFVSEDTDTTAFYLVETIRKEGWNKYAAAEGLLVAQATYNAKAWKDNKVNVGNNYCHYVVPANNHWSIVGDYSPTLHLFGTENDTFTATSSPASTTPFGVTMDKPLTSISYDKSTGKTTFHFCGGNITDSVEDIKAYDPKIRSAYYDLQGRRVENPSNGIYVRDGKKVVIK